MTQPMIPLPSLVPAVVSPPRNILAKRAFTATAHPDIVIDQNGNRCIDVSKVIELPDRARKQYKMVLELADSMKELGVLQPIKLKMEAEGQFSLVHGGRRRRAFVATGERYIPFTLEGEDTLWAKEAELAENAERDDLPWADICVLRAQIDKLKRAKYGDGTVNVEGWTLDKTAALLSGSDKPVAASGHLKNQIKLGNKILKDPTLKEKFQHLPMTAALKAIKREEQRGKRTEGIAAGTITVHGGVLFKTAQDMIRDDLKPATVNLWLTDPPFGNETIQGGTDSARSNMVYTGLIKPTDNMAPLDMQEMMQIVVPGMASRMIVGGHFYMFYAMQHHEFLRLLLFKNGFLVQPKPLIWYKGKTSTVASGYNYPSSYEPILWGHYQEVKTRLVGENLRDVLEYAPVSINKRLHQFQKPKKLLVDLISASTLPGDLVVDTFAGSGSTIKAALELQRNALGSEIDKENWTAAQMNLVSGAIPEEPVK